MRKKRMQRAVGLVSAKLKSKHGLKDLDLEYGHSSKTMHIGMIQVPRDKRKMGVGSRSLADLSKFADRRKLTTTLSLADRNPSTGTTSKERLRKFYSKSGFVSNRGRNKRFDLSVFTSMYRKPKTESYFVISESTGFKIDRVEVKDGTLPTQKRAHYHFKHKYGSGQVIIHYGKGMESKVDFRVSRSSREPDTHNAKRIIRTVEKAVRHHIRKEKPKMIGYHALSDEHDKSGKNRRDAIYQKIIRRVGGKKWKPVPVTSSLAGRRKFKKVGR